MPRSDQFAYYQVPREHIRPLKKRVAISFAILTILFLILVGRLVYLQLISHGDYVALSRDNRVQIVPVPPTRGHIYDRNGVLLAGNETAYRLAITPRYVEDIDALLAEIKNLVAVSDDEIVKFKRSLQFSNKHSAVVLKDFLLQDEVARIAVDRYKLPGVSIITDLHRVYESSVYTSHVVGTLSRIDQADLERLDRARYRGLQYIGKSGIELASEEMLVGSSGHAQIETNAHGRKIRVLSHASPTTGSDVYLTVDVDLQKIAYDALGDVVGALVALDPSTGQVLAMVSKPSFDANQFGISGEREKRVDLLTDEASPLLNRAVQGQYPPGSTIKPFLAFAGLEAGFGQRTVNCPGWFSLPDHSHKYRCWKSEGHGRVNMYDAIAESCDVFFYVLARALGIDEMYYQLSKFGFGSLTGVELSYEKPGILPSREWKQWSRQEPWYEGETLITGIGQGATLLSMLQLAHATSIIANKGYKFRPQLILKEIDIVTGEEFIREADLVEEIDVSKSYFDWVTKAMEEVVHGNRGTARRINEGIDYRIAGKTGTVQVIRRKQDEEFDLETTPKKFHPHGVFTAFAPANNPEIVVSVIVENGVGGSLIAPIAKEVIDYYLKMKPDSEPSKGDSFAIISDR